MLAMTMRAHCGKHAQWLHRDREAKQEQLLPIADDNAWAYRGQGG